MYWSMYFSQSKWEIWQLEDSGRAKMPQTEDDVLTFPCGMAISLNTQKDIALHKYI